MSQLKSLWVSVMDDPVFLMKFNGWATVFWLLMIIPTIFWWKNSIEYLVAVSVYAVIMGHLSTWQAARVEVKQDVAADVAAKKE